MKFLESLRIDEFLRYFLAGIFFIVSFFITVPAATNSSLKETNSAPKDLKELIRLVVTPSGEAAVPDKPSKQGREAKEQQIRSDNVRQRTINLTGVIGISAVAGFTIYVIHRAVFYPLTEKAAWCVVNVTRYPFHCLKRMCRFCLKKTCRSPSDCCCCDNNRPSKCCCCLRTCLKTLCESAVRRDVQRWRRHAYAYEAELRISSEKALTKPDFDVIQWEMLKQLRLWGSHVHFLYCASFALLAGNLVALDFHLGAKQIPPFDTGMSLAVLSFLVVGFFYQCRGLYRELFIERVLKRLQPHDRE